jgi:hypothetical protein
MAAPRDPRIVLEQMLEAILDIEQITAIPRRLQSLEIPHSTSAP